MAIIDNVKEEVGRLPLHERAMLAYWIITGLEEIDEPQEDDDSLDDSMFFTETLSRIYIKQKKYEKAYKIIQQLSLNYPEKNSYFADQIRFLEKLIINTSKNKK